MKIEGMLLIVTLRARERRRLPSGRQQDKQACPQDHLCMHHDYPLGWNT
jgi:hypothetical protein